MSEGKKGESGKKVYEYALQMSEQLSIVSSQMAHVQYLRNNKKLSDTELQGAEIILNHALKSIRDQAQIAFDMTKEPEFQKVIGKLNEVMSSLNKKDWTAAFAVFQVNTSPQNTLLGMKEKFKQ